MSRPSRGPGPRSIVALRWLTRVGASPGEPLALVMGWSEQAMYDHVARLQRAGLVTRIPMTRGDGSLIVVTRRRAAGQGRPARSSTSSRPDDLGGCRRMRMDSRVV